MSQLIKATLTPLDGDRTPTPSGPDIPVQFNPTTLRLVLSNNVEGGKTATRPAEQYTGTSSAELSMDLVFDTADEGTTGAPRSVRDKTRQVAQFVLPRTGGGNLSPPRIRFHWGDLVFEGVMTSFTEDIDLFDATGTPLRSKVSISIHRQDPRYESLATGAGAGAASGALLPGGISAAAGVSASAGFSASGGVGLAAGAGVTAGLGASAQASVALGGETAAGFAARMGLDPTAWRGLDLGGESPLSLSAGAQVGFSASISAGAGPGFNPGVQAGLGSSLAAAIGLPSGPTAAGVTGVQPASGPANIPTSSPTSNEPTFVPGGPPAVPAGMSGSAAAAGYALTSAGGVSATVSQALTARSSAAAQSERAAFAPTATVPTVPSATVPSATGSQTLVAPAPGPVAASAPDDRALSFGRGIPLRALVGGPAGASAVAPVLSPRPSPNVPELSADPTVAPWIGLPAADPARAPADAEQSRRSPKLACGCQGGCAHTHEIGAR